MSVSPKKTSRSSKKSSKTVTVETESSPSTSFSRIPATFKNKKRSKVSSSNYVTPWTFDPSRIIFGKAERKTGITKGVDGAASTTYEYYEPSIEYRYPNGTIGPLCLRFTDSIKMGTLITKKKSQTVKDSNGKTKTLTFDAATMGLVFEINPELGDVLRSKFDPECEDDSLITQQEILDSYINNYQKKLKHISNWIVENIPEYASKKPDFIFELATTSMPQHRKEKVSKKLILSSPLQIYYDLRSYTFLKDKTDIDSEIYVKTNIKNAGTGNIIEWADATEYSMWGDVFVEFNRLHIKTSNGWSLKGSITDVIVNNLKVKENMSDQRSNEVMDEYTENEIVKQRMINAEQEIQLKRLKKLNAQQQKQLEKPSESGSDPSTKTPDKTKIAASIPNLDADSGSDSEDDMAGMSLESVIGQ